MKHRAAFLCLDGIDGTGKSTQIRLLADYLRNRGHDVLAVADPGGTPLGSELRAILLDRKGELCVRSEALLFMASRAQLVESVIRPALEAGTVVLADRFVVANIVYQGRAGGLPVEGLRQLGTFSCDGVFPDRILILDLPEEEAAIRRGRAADRVESRPPDYHRRVREGFLREAERDPHTIRVLDATPDIDTVHRRIVAAFADLIPDPID